MRTYVAAAAVLTVIPVIAWAADYGAKPNPPAATSAAPEAAPAPGTVVVGPRWTACTAEVQKFCSTIERGKGKMRECLEAHAAEASDACKARLAEH
jgi:hypothetical protein